MIDMTSMFEFMTDRWPQQPHYSVLDRLVHSTHHSFLLTAIQ